MTERERDINYIKNQFDARNLRIPNDEELDLICDLLDGTYIKGVKQGEFDMAMDIIGKINKMI